jgi:hypothetical protein
MFTPGAPNAAALTHLPDPQPERVAAGSPAPSRTGRLLNLVRKLIDYGKALVTTLHGRPSATNLADITGKFGTRNIALILSLITRALHRAVALEARVLGWGARPDQRPEATGARFPRKPRAARQASVPAAQSDPRLARLPTPEELAEEVRRRPIAAVLADICRGLGIVPSDPLWRDLGFVITEYGGSIGALFRQTGERLALGRARWPAITLPAWPAPSQPLPAASGAGPP